MKTARTKKRTRKPAWVNYDKDEVERIVIKLAQKGNTQSQIGMILRDQYGVPSLKIFKTTVSEIFKKNKINQELPEDLFNLLKKVVGIYNHLEKNKKDKKNRHMLQLTESKIRKLAKYYIRRGKLPKNWKYSIDKARLIVK